jgi:hypothetical protein
MIEKQLKNWHLPVTLITKETVSNFWTKRMNVHHVEVIN